MLEIFFLALALSMDAFAVAIGLGSKRCAPGTALQAGLYFGVFQALMPLIGYLGGRSLLGWLDGYTHWLAFALLLAIGLKMVLEGFRDNPEKAIPAPTGQVLLLLALATSIDALAAGFTLPLLPVNAYLACLLIGVTTFLLSMLGVAIGRRTGTWLESKAELFGGTVLIVLGFKFLLA